ncbi:MAG: transposase [Thermotogota bacterium]
MPRAKRIESETGIYHVLLSGINKQTIFKDEEDNEQFLVTVNQFKKKSGYQLLAYCLMGNHIHLLMKTEGEALGQVFRRIGASFVYWYNRKYDRMGHLFQDRFKSEVVETDNYLLTCLRYIHQNPVKAGIIEDIESYVWSSYLEYLGIINDHHVDKDYVLNLFDEDRAKAVADFKAFHEIDNDDQCLDMTDRKRMSDEKAIHLIKRELPVNSEKDIKNLDPEQKAKCVQVLLKQGLSVRQISRLTGISRYFIQPLIQNTVG